MKIVNVEKFISSILLILGTIILITFCINNVSLSHGESVYKIIYVSNGDTLWSIAREEISSNDYYFGKDIRDVIKDIASINQINNSNLKIGIELKIPTLR